MSLAEAVASPVSGNPTDVPADADLEQRWPEQHGESVAAPDESKLLTSHTVDGVHPCLAVTRAVCVCCACLDVGDAAYRNWNVICCKAWVLQFSFLVAGISFAISKKPAVEYVLRLLSFFSIGTCCNWVASVIAGADSGDLAGVVHHLWFLAGLAGMATILSPFKQHLRRVSQEVSDEKLDTVFRGNDMSVVSAAVSSAMDACYAMALAAEQRLPKQYPFADAICEGMSSVHLRLRAVMQDAAASVQSRRAPFELLCTCTVLFSLWCVMRIIYCWAIVPLLGNLVAALMGADLHPPSGYDGFVDADTDVSKVAFHVVEESLMRVFPSASSVLLAVVFSSLSKQLSVVAWLMVANNYGLRLLQSEGPAAIEMVLGGFDTFALGLTCYYYGLSQRRWLGEYMTRYWFLLLFTISVLCPTGHLLGRWEPHPDVASHCKGGEVLAEMLLVMFYISAMEHLVDPRIFTKDQLFIVRWAPLPLFMFARAVRLVFPPPLSWFVLATLTAISLGKALDWEKMLELAAAFLQLACERLAWGNFVQLATALLSPSR